MVRAQRIPLATTAAAVIAEKMFARSQSLIPLAIRDDIPNVCFYIIMYGSAIFLMINRPCFQLADTPVKLVYGSGELENAPHT
jgi:hypothetical protein